MMFTDTELQSFRDERRERGGGQHLNAESNAKAYILSEKRVHVTSCGELEEKKDLPVLDIVVHIEGGGGARACRDAHKGKDVW